MMPPESPTRWRAAAGKPRCWIEHLSQAALDTHRVVLYIAVVVTVSALLQVFGVHLHVFGS